MEKPPYGNMLWNIHTEFTDKLDGLNPNSTPGDARETFAFYHVTCDFIAKHLSKIEGTFLNNPAITNALSLWTEHETYHHQLRAVNNNTIFRSQQLNTKLREVSDWLKGMTQKIHFWYEISKANSITLLSSDLMMTEKIKELEQNAFSVTENKSSILSILKNVKHHARIANERALSLTERNNAVTDNLIILNELVYAPPMK